MTLNAALATTNQQWSPFVIVAAMGGIVALVLLAIIMHSFRLWLQVYMSNADVSLLDLIGMRLRKVNPAPIVLAKIQLVKAGIREITVNDLESHYLAGGRVPNVTGVVITAKLAGSQLDWRQVCAEDLAGRGAPDEKEKQLPVKEVQWCIGQAGRSATPVWPIGYCEFAGKQIPGVVEHGMITAGSNVEAVRACGPIVVVRETDA